MPRPADGRDGPRTRRPVPLRRAYPAGRPYSGRGTEGQTLAPTAAVDRLRLGDHVCWDFDDDDGRLETIGRFVEGGIRAHHRGRSLTEPDTPARLRTALAARGARV